VKIPVDEAPTEDVFRLGTPSSAPGATVHDKPASKPLYDPRYRSRQPTRNTRLFDDRTILTERAINSIPIFTEFDRRLTFPADSTELPSTANEITINLVDDGIFSIPFQKFESWTDIKIRFHCSGYVDTANTFLAVRARLTDQAGKITDIPDVTRFYFSQADAYHTLWGERRVGDILPGVYTLTYRWEVSQGSFFFNENCTMHGSIIELSPIP
jgi:hypothetical protein